jgi:RHS repeat-associated protein
MEKNVGQRRFFLVITERNKPLYLLSKAMRTQYRHTSTFGVSPYKDHLNNVLLRFSENEGYLEIVEENNYYPFGLQHKGYNGNYNPLGNSTAQNYKYNGKELEEGLDYDMYEYGARHYDPALGRFVILDRLSEDYSFQTPYAYAANNPVIYIDKNGDGPILGIVGALAGAVVETGSQIIGNVASGAEWNDLDYADIGIAAVEGGVAGLTNGASLVVGGFVADAAKAAVDVKMDNGQFETTTVVNGSKTVLDTGVELAVGQLGGALAKETGQFVKNVTKKAENMVEGYLKKSDVGTSLSEKTLKKDVSIELNNGGAEAVIDVATNSAEKVSTAAQSKILEVAVKSQLPKEE